MNFCNPSLSWPRAGRILPLTMAGHSNLLFFLEWTFEMSLRSRHTSFLLRSKRLCQKEPGYRTNVETVLLIVSGSISKPADFRIALHYKLYILCYKLFTVLQVLQTKVGFFRKWNSVFFDTSVHTPSDYLERKKKKKKRLI